MERKELFRALFGSWNYNLNVETRKKINAIVYRLVEYGIKGV